MKKSPEQKVGVICQGLAYRAAKRTQAGNWTNPFVLPPYGSELNNCMYDEYQEQLDILVKQVRTCTCCGERTFGDLDW